MIRLIEHTDAEELYALVEENRDYLRQWLPWLDMNTSINDTKRFITKCLQDYAAGKSMVYAIIADQICGVCGFNSINDSIKAGYIGYWLSRQQQGKGLATSSVTKLETIGFEQLKLNKIEIHAATGNIKSRKIAEGLGYTNTGAIIDAEWLYDHYVDHVIYCKKVER